MLEFCGVLMCCKIYYCIDMDGIRLFFYFYKRLICFEGVCVCVYEGLIFINSEIIGGNERNKFGRWWKLNILDEEEWGLIFFIGL